MIRQNKTLVIITSIVILVPMLVGVLLWNSLPEQLAVHFGVDGQPDRWSSRGFVVFAMPLIFLALHLLTLVITSADSRYAGTGRKMNALMVWIVPAVSILSMVLSYGVSMGGGVDVNFVMMILLGGMFVVIGNYLPKVSQNHTVGIRIPWTLKDEENWNRTHRLAGWVWMIAGILILATSFLRSVPVFIGLMLAAVLIPVIYSLVLWLKRKN